MPINAFVEVTWTLNVAPAFELVASTRNCRLPDEYSATYMLTVSVEGVGVGVGVSVGVGVTVSVASRSTGSPEERMK